MIPHSPIDRISAGVLLGGLLLFLFPLRTLSAQDTLRYHLRNSKSHIAFKVQHMGFLTVEGTFGEFDGNLQLPPRGKLPADLVGTLQLAVGSVDTDNALRDRSLISDSFFHVEKYPTILVSIRSWKQAEGETQAVATIEIMGVASTITVPVAVQFRSPDRRSILLEGEVTLRRSELDLVFSSPMDGLIGDEVTVTFAFRADSVSID